MASTQTPTQQRNSFSEGFAFGLILNGRWSLVYDKSVIDLAVAGAFRDWPYAATFPQVRTDLRGLDGVHAMTRVDESKRTFAFYWDRSGPEMQIVSRDPDWSEEVPDDVSYAVGVINDFVPRAGWQDLAASFLTRVER
ncbi:hypothetical protein BJK06_11215 [Curtobacterium sp. BH-2-1-1]|uniref:hypothetical protein n=1 Tax=Curtobacterium sp. BH-2-1-1 TaxID=1905847 RepID=UPI00089E04C1|nr:hypothetical protein [Curtobacterium sp. BH-2-1-1]AOX66249.1 hypothetical protein BJK06_11215 [Curtobacterium sp. BH-2-1-1]